MKMQDILTVLKKPFQMQVATTKPTDSSWNWQTKHREPIRWTFNLHQEGLKLLSKAVHQLSTIMIFRTPGMIVANQEPTPMLILRFRNKLELQIRF